MNGSKPTTRRRPHASPATAPYRSNVNSAQIYCSHVSADPKQLDDDSDADQRKKRRNQSSFFRHDRIRNRLRWCVVAIIFTAAAKPNLRRFASRDGYNITSYREKFSFKHAPHSHTIISIYEYEQNNVIEEIIEKYDDIDNRDRTSWALFNSECRPQREHIEDTMLGPYPSIGYINQRPRNETQSYIDDGMEWGWRGYYAFDDDYIRNTAAAEEENQQCMRPSWYNMYYPTCNEIHSVISGEQWILQDDSLYRKWSKDHGDAPMSKYLGSGFYRNAFLLQKQFVQTRQQSSTPYDNAKAPIEFDEVVFKSMKQLDKETERYSYIELMEDMRKDAMVMELLTSSPRSANIYSFCGLSSVIEFAPIDIEKYIRPLNYQQNFLRGRHNGFEDRGLGENNSGNDHIPPEEKLEIALEIAKCLAEMHGFADGPIAHVDVQTGQFFRGRDGRIKIVDYNRAEALLYDINQDEYCTFRNGLPPDGMYRAPEENIDAPLTEKIDVFSLGNVLYYILTGTMVHSDRESSEAVQRIVDGITEPIADTYYEEPSTAALAEAIQMCWTYLPEKRPTIFELVQFLEDAKEKRETLPPPHTSLSSLPL